MVRSLRLVLVFASLAALSFPVLGQQTDSDSDATAQQGVKLRWGIEARAHYRDSNDDRFSIAAPPQVEIPPGVVPQLQTVDPGQHVEISTVTLLLDAEWSDSLLGHVKIDTIDLYDRNPTSEDYRVDVDEAWLRMGRQSETALLPDKPGIYAKIGKMPKFERQNDRHLESYGLVSTAFNRFEDTGIEVGADLGRYFYLRGSLTQGNPVFFRDPNALAGDNGTEPQLRPLVPGEQLGLGSGILILYDAEVEDLDVDGNLETGVGLGGRWSSVNGDRGIDFLAWGYRRRLAETVELHGTLYGGDLDLLRGPFNAAPAPLKGNRKEEVGANFWLYWDGLTLFAQAVDQDLAGLGRRGYEVEAAYRFDLPVVAGVGGRQLFPSIAPAVRWSRLDPDFRTHPLFPAPSIAWEWEKVDAGIRVTIVEGIDLTLEYASHTMTLFSGRKADHDELLTTLRWKM